jgi:hypothetical protein
MEYVLDVVSKQVAEDAAAALAAHAAPVDV